MKATYPSKISSRLNIPPLKGRRGEGSGWVGGWVGERRNPAPSKKSNVKRQRGEQFILESFNVGKFASNLHSGRPHLLLPGPMWHSPNHPITTPTPLIPSTSTPTTLFHLLIINLIIIQIKMQFPLHTHTHINL